MELIPKGATANKHCFKEILNCKQALLQGDPQLQTSTASRRSFAIYAFKFVVSVWSYGTRAGRSFMMMPLHMALCLAKQQVTILPHPPYSPDHPSWKEIYVGVNFSRPSSCHCHKRSHMGLS
jgi:hypothetical protein